MLLLDAGVGVGVAAETVVKGVLDTRLDALLLAAWVELGVADEAAGKDTTSQLVSYHRVSPPDLASKEE